MGVLGKQRFRSLRWRLLAPLIGASVLAAILVAVTSAWLGTRWVTQNFDERFVGIEHALSDSSFPLTAPVLNLLADLTDSELVTFRESSETFKTTLPIGESDFKQITSAARSPGLRGRNRFFVTVGGRTFLAYSFRRSRAALPADASQRVIVLFDEEHVEAMRWRAAMLPLITGLSTIALLGTLSFYTANWLILRLRRLQTRVEFVASGDFESSQSDHVHDEIGLLASAVDSMARQLKELWRALHRQQSEKLLHQVSSGMAHQLRNTLTGARLALELHVRHHANDEGNEIKVALHEVEQAEEYIRRLLLVALGQQAKDRKTSAYNCLCDVRSSLSATGEHLKVSLSWQFESLSQNCNVKDGPTFVAALNNLVLNAMQAGTTVSVTARVIDRGHLSVSVVDDGPGVADAIAAEIFEPFITSKPEGLGLGLPLVRRAAEHLEGKVQWCREGAQTVFQLTVRCFERDEC